jgi:hypothetical protein
MKGWLVPAHDAARARNAAETVDMKEVFRLVAPDNVIRYEGGPLKLLLVDAGAKDNMVRSLLNSGSGVFDAGNKCLLGIMSRKICVKPKGKDAEGEEKDIAKYFEPASKIRAFIPTEYRF